MRETKNGCCASPPSSDVRMVSDRPQPPCSITQASAKLLDGAPGSVSLSPFKDLRSQLTDLRHRQEELFRQLMDHQNGLQSQLSVMQSASRASADAQAVLKERQEDLITEFRTFSSKCKEVGVGRISIKTDEHPCGNFRPIPSISTESITSTHSLKSPAHMEGDFDGKCLDPSSPSSSKPCLRRSVTSDTQGTIGSSKRSRSKESALRFSNQSQGAVEEEVQDKGLKARVQRLLKCKEFEFGIAGAIMVNAFIMCWECQYSGLDVGFNLEYPGRQVPADDVWPGAEKVFNVFDWFFGLLFLAELIVKLACWHCKYFYSSEGLALQDDDVEENKPQLLCSRFLWGVQGWNLLDFFAVLAFVSDKGAAVGSVNPQMLRLLRLFRLFRLVRVVRVLESMDHLYIMTTAISALRKVLSWAVVLLTIMLLACDLLLVQVLHATYFNKVTASDLTKDQLQKHHQMYEYFGTCTRCMLSMFEITLGNWPPIARLLSEEVSEWFTLFCLAHKLTIGFAVIGVITGVILQETFKVAQTDDVIMFRQKKLASITLRKKMKNLFEALDQEGDGRLEEAEFTAIGDLPEIKCWLASLDIETDDLKTLFSLIDLQGNGYITLDELVARMPRIKGNARGIDMLAMRHNLQA